MDYLEFKIKCSEEFREILIAELAEIGFDSFLDYVDGNIKGWTQQRYMPRLATYPLESIPFDFHELIAALAPRFCYVSAPKNDGNFKWQSVDKIAAAARRIYQLYDAENKLRVEHPECGHDLPDEVLERMFNVFVAELKPKHTAP